MTNLFAVLEKTISIFITDVGDNDLYLPNQYNAGLLYISKVKERMRSLGVSESVIGQYFDIEDAGDLYQNKKPIKIHLIQPENNLGGGPGGLVFDPAEMKNMLLQGQLALQSYVAGINTGDVDWA
ncbi:hypothetical protein [Niabella ginsengisoli]|uniref:Uncharacterized protein n=1 Tax=Niabella ginsengisoli TaxID=522298 RepID=A0ABS9SDT1_9BACT|nr:hypothetical protein [Niabella ginsengisoli]MCH5596496.1 hypothetical protein [Niabella ginsengisoli]